MSDTKYWDDYYEYWDRFVKEWFEFMKATKSDAINLAIDFGKASGLNLDELPTPYLGSPHRKESVEAVFLNLNPGMSEKGRMGIIGGLIWMQHSTFQILIKGRRKRRQVG